MKLVLMMILALPAIGSAETLRSSKIKAQICEVADDKIHLGRFDINTEDCLKAKFTLIDSVELEIKGKKKPLTTLMKVESSIKGVTFVSSLKAILNVSDRGNISRTGFEVFTVSTTDLNDEALVRSSWSHSENVKEVDAKGLPKKVQAKINKYEVDVDYIDNNDIEIGERVYSIIKNLKTGKTVGYLLSMSVASESADRKHFYTIKFDAKGKEVDFDVEEYGYYE